MTAQPLYLYLGLAGETAPGRIVDSGLFRLADGNNEWVALQRGHRARPGQQRIGAAARQRLGRVRRPGGHCDRLDEFNSAQN